MNHNASPEKNPFKGLHYYTEEKMLNKKVRCLARDHLKQMVDDNIPFWDEFRRATAPVVAPN